ncbi:MAG: hypothetical protein FD148_2859 [Methylocystaceae bacterium]|nr:MAG: hypothetical protein FD148_2859 [Methylocystaceae bacterium]
MSDDEIPPVELDQSEEALVVRPELAISVSTLPAGGSAFVDALRSGGTFGEAVNAATALAADFKLTECLRELFLTGAFVALSVAH